MISGGGKKWKQVRGIESVRGAFNVSGMTVSAKKGGDENVHEIIVRGSGKGTGCVKCGSASLHGEGEQGELGGAGGPSQRCCQADAGSGCTVPSRSLQPRGATQLLKCGYDPLRFKDFE